MSESRIVLGLMGGIGAGKSHVARALARETSASVVDADEVARTALDTCARDGRLTETLGPGFVTPERTPDRPAIARHVFSDPAALRALERLTHPGILAIIAERIHEHRRGRGPALLVIDAPLLIETGLDRQCDALWFVDAPDETRLSRAAKNGLTPEDVRRREAHQAPLDRKRARADRVIRNDVPPADLEAQLREGLATLGTKRTS